MSNKILTFFLSVLAITITSCSSDDSPSSPISIVIEGAEVAPAVGGPNQQNQVYIDLSTNSSTVVQRDSWDLGFYSGTQFRVVLNGSIAMAAAELSTTDIDAVSSSDQEVIDLQPLVRTNTYSNESTPFVDAPNGEITGTAISEISTTDDNNKVYLVNLGYEVGTETPESGIALNGDARGWMKIRVLKDGDNFVLHYADLDATTHQEITISKTPDFSFTFFSFNTESVVSVEPATTLWDLNFTVFTNEIPGYGPYVYSDFVANNIRGGAKVYMIDTDVNTELNYNDFTIDDVVINNFENDQRTIGSSWRNGGGPNTSPSLKDNVFYIILDTDGNLYKLKFLAMSNAEDVRGYPEFVYALLQ